MTAPPRRARRKPAPPIEIDYPAKIALIMEDYEGFLATHPGEGEAEEPKAFAARHTAARTALAHLEQLFKVMQEQPGQPDGDAGQAALLLARAEMARLAQEVSETDDGSADGDAGGDA
jgi:hypothetical protein